MASDEHTDTTTSEEQPDEPGRETEAEDAHSRFQPSLVTEQANMRPEGEQLDGDDRDEREALVDEVEDDR